MQDQILRTAYHEAGHALIGAILGIGVDEIGIDLRDESGYVDACLPATLSPADEALFYAAGCGAELLCLGDYELHGVDRTELERLGRLTGKDPKLLVVDALWVLKDHRGRLNRVVRRILCHDPIIDLT